MKTPIQEAIDLIEDYTGVYCTSEGATFSYLTPEGVKDLLESMIEKEKETWIDAYEAGYDDAADYYSVAMEDRSTAEQRFTETFNK